VLKSKILLFGKNGQVAYELIKKLESIAELIICDRAEADFSDPQSVKTALNLHQPQIIINAVAYTAVDKAEEESKLAFIINSETPKAIADYAKANGSLFIHYSTDFVFDGNSDDPYSEISKTSPISVYGKSKLAGDEAVLESGCAAIIFRTSWVYGLRGKNFLLTMRRLAETREELKIVYDQIGSPTWCGFIAQSTKEVLLNVLKQMHDIFDLNKIPEKYLGLFNLSASNSTSWYQFALAIVESDPNKKNHLCKKMIPIPSTEYPTPAQRPQFSVLDNTKLMQTFKLTIPTWEEQLRTCLYND